MGEWQTRAFRELMTPVDRIVGTATAKALAALNIATLKDLVGHLPRHLMSGTEQTDIVALIRDYGASDDYVALVATLDQVVARGQAPKQRVEVTLTDGHATITATFFGRPQHIAYWQNVLSRSERGIFAGKLTWFNGSPQLAHPAFAMITPDGLIGSAQNQKMARQVTRSAFIGLYPQTAKLPTWTIAECVDLGLTRLHGVDDPLPERVRSKASVLEFGAALEAVHHPQTRAEHDRGVERLLFDEAFATQIAMAARRADTSRHTAVPRASGPGGLLARFDARLTYALTDQQRAVGEEIAAELNRTRPMQRLLQGEVGSGKTIVALRAMLTVVDGGGQAALLAPTEVLAQQHAYTVGQLLGDLGQGPLLGGGDATTVAVLTGSLSAAERRVALDRIASGEAGIVIGTHALLGDQVRFADLGLVVVDEQHRFGVEQRTSLATRGGAHPHVLVMTATPIPRSIAMTLFGDLDVSVLTEIPAGRAPVATTVVDAALRPAWVERAWQRVHEEVAAGRQVYIVVPRISGDDDTIASIEAVRRDVVEGPLKDLRVGLLHGRLPSAEKTATMAGFAAGELDVLLATSMIEVGLDVANASMMVVVDADRFGVSQLHQLRGRIGRGAHPGVCLLLTKAAADSPARRRLDVVAATHDGFAIAQADLEQRREGDVLGLSQSGRTSSLRLLRVVDHVEIIEKARQIAEAVIASPEPLEPGLRDYIHEVDLLAANPLDEVA